MWKCTKNSDILPHINIPATLKQLLLSLCNNQTAVLKSCSICQQILFQQPCIHNLHVDPNCTGFFSSIVSVFSGHKNSSFYIKSTVSPDDQFLASGSSDHDTYIWKVSSPLILLCAALLCQAVVCLSSLNVILHSRFLTPRILP